MKILILSWYFPPVNSIGAVRIGKLARFLDARGHEIGVAAGSDWGLPETLPLGFTLEKLAYAKVRDINAPPRLANDLLRRMRGGGAAGDAVGASAGTATGTSLARRARDFYTNLLNVPDNRIGWYPDLVRQALRLTRGWRPDIVFGSAPPFTALLACRRVARRLGVPWVAELRDAWADDTYSPHPPWRLAIDQRVERFVLGSAAGLVCVTEPWSDFYRAKYGKPVETAYNGYDPADFPFDPAAPPAGAAREVRIVYTGGIYPGRRDPTPLFEALRLIGPEADGFRVEFFGTDPAAVWPLADRVGVRRLVAVHPPVPFRESIAAQWNADVLLLLQWNDPREHGICPGKFFEYLGSLRPILGIGYEQGVPAGFVRARKAGVFANEPAKIAEHLRGWAAEKAAHGCVRRLPVAVREGLERYRQYEKLEAFLARFVGNN
ncbi:MAG TPA: glycosyltransferase [Alphaproteobacteria bacterium]